MHFIHLLYECRWVSIVSSFHHFLYNILPFYCYSYFLKILIMVLARSQYENMSKEELIQELTNINSSFVNDINAKLTDLCDRFNEFTSKYDKVYSELQQCKSYNSHLLTRIIQLNIMLLLTLNIVGKRQLNWTLFLPKFTMS